MPNRRQLLDDADREVRAKSDARVGRETAQKWAARALACYRACSGTSGAVRLRWLLRAEDYRHEALEHAALVGDGGALVGEIEREIERARPPEVRARPRRTTSRR